MATISGDPHDEPAVGPPPVPELPGPRDEPADVGPGTITRTRASGLWVSVAVALLVLLALAVFILQNGDHVKVSYLGAHGSLPLGVALLLAAVFGGLVVVLAGTVRILELRRRARGTGRARHHGRARSSAP
ncbi:MAG: lipopolysaccharide assembly protein LapA domain-containing protein [Actinomycetota bacterium]|nr:lipopolysaccharide assembly protein LapA domain-containing protein [Actinomycetota bacterium]